MPPEPRSAHPYHMFDAIQAQPEAFAGVVERLREPSGEVARLVRAGRRTFLVGIGTSFHAAQVGAHLLRTSAPELDVQAIHAFDFALYGPVLQAGDCVLVVSHRGTKRFALESLQRARAAGCRTVLITGEGGVTGEAPAQMVLETVAQDPSSAHTVSFTGAVAALAAISQQIGAEAPLDPALLSETVPTALCEALETEGRVATLAREHAGRRHLWLAGGGPGAITATEAALKIKETSYRPAEGFAIEALLHGPFQAADPADLVVLIAPSGPAQPRVLELARSASTIGAACILVSDGSAQLPEGAVADVVRVPPLPEPLSVLSCLLPLQLFAYYLALDHGANPDSFRLDDPRFAAAYALVRL